ncbi:MAG: dihydropteroate synthase [Bacteroidales bacterium]|jgi:dihydropteroate synthase|nr:dihydropteroate synthase [Bacteroidales bacterium]
MYKSTLKIPIYAQTDKNYFRIYRGKINNNLSIFVLMKMDFSTPKVMGILNLTPDSFYDGGRYAFTSKAYDNCSVNSGRDNWRADVGLALKQVELMVEQGVDIVDIGSVSTRPGSVPPATEEEWARMADVLAAVRREYPSLTISIDTYRAEIARRAVSAGADIINDVAGGTMDAEMFATVASLGCPYILTHIKGTPDNMQQQPFYEDVVREVSDFFTQHLAALNALGVQDVILDVGFGMGKTLENNYTLLRELRTFEKFGKPLLAGISHKSMLWRLLEITPADTLNATTAANMLALTGGAKILRVHEVREAKECVKIFTAWM